MTLGNTVPLARTFSKCAATDKAFNSPHYPFPTPHSPLFCASFFCWVAKKLLFSKRFVVRERQVGILGGGRLPVVFAANKQQGAREKKEFKGGVEMAEGEGGTNNPNESEKKKKSVCILHSQAKQCRRYQRRTVGRPGFSVLFLAFLPQNSHLVPPNAASSCAR